MKKLLTFIVFATVFMAGKAQTCDTLFNLISPLDTPTYYLADTTLTAGYLSGNNEYGDLAKAEAFKSVIGDSVTSALLYFSLVTINSADSNTAVKVMVWDNSGTANNGNVGAPGVAIDSATVTLRQIANDVTYSIANQTLVGTLVNFNGSAKLNTDTFYVGVVLPTTAGDTVVLFTNKVSPGPDGNGWELNLSNSGPVWGTYNNDWGFTGGSEGNYIVVSICSGGVTGITQVSNVEQVKIYPNPATDVLNLEWNVNAEAAVSVYDVTGNVVKSYTINNTGVNSLNIHDLAAGSYIIRITDTTSKEQRSLLFNKM